MAATIDDITINYEEDGLLKVKELDKVVLSKGAWTTIIFRFTQWDNKLGGYGPDRYIIRRYRKQNDEYRSQSKFAISSRDQARKIIAALQQWVDLPEE